MLQSTKLYCGGGDLSALDVTDIPRLQELRCSDSAGLRTLRLGRQEALTKLDCANTGIGELDVSGCTALTGLNCGGSAGLRTLRLGRNAALLSLACGGTGLSELDVSGCGALEWLECAGNPALRSLVPGGRLQYLRCADTGLTELDVSSLGALEWLECDGCAGLRALRLGRQEALRYLACGGTGLSELDLSGCPNLREFACGQLALERFISREGHALRLRASGGAVALSGYEPATGRVRLTATADAGRRFAGWLGLPAGAASAPGTCAFTLRGDAAVGALFESARAQAAFWWDSPCGGASAAAKAPLRRALP